MEPSDLSDTIQLTAEAEHFPIVKPEAIQLDKFLLKVEQELIHRALRQAGNNRAQAARLLGISRGRLLRRIELFTPDRADSDDGATEDDGAAGEFESA